MKTLFFLAAVVCLGLAGAYWFGPGLLWNREDPAVKRFQTLFTDLRERQTRLRNRLDREIPQVEAMIADHAAAAIRNYDASASDATKLVLREELRSTFVRRAVLPDYEKECREAAMRVDSLLRTMRQTEAMPDAELGEVEAVSAFVATLTEQNVLDIVDARQKRNPLGDAELDLAVERWREEEREKGYAVKPYRQRAAECENGLKRLLAVEPGAGRDTFKAMRKAQARDLEEARGRWTKAKAADARERIRAEMLDRQRRLMAVDAAETEGGRLLTELGRILRSLDREEGVVPFERRAAWDAVLAAGASMTEPPDGDCLLPFLPDEDVAGARLADWMAALDREEAAREDMAAYGVEAYGKRLARLERRLKARLGVKTKVYASGELPDVEKRIRRDRTKAFEQWRDAADETTRGQLRTELLEKQRRLLAVPVYEGECDAALKNVASIRRLLSDMNPKDVVPGAKREAWDAIGRQAEACLAGTAAEMLAGRMPPPAEAEKALAEWMEAEAEKKQRSGARQPTTPERPRGGGMLPARPAPKGH